jgi:GT2 family glycosyltransferase
VSRPEVSVVVPTFRRPQLLRACVESFDRQGDAVGFEMVVVDDGSGDETPAVLDRLAHARPWLRWSRNDANLGPAAARNRALAQASGRLVLFVDDDIVAAPDLVRTHVELHRAAGDDRLAVLGRVSWHPALAVTPFMRWLDRSGLQFGYDTWLREGPVAVPASAFYTANLSMRRELVTEVGGFDERFPFPAYEDLELATRLTDHGLRMEYRPAALAYHRRAIDLPTFVRRMARVGESAELMRSVRPDFAIDDTALRAHRAGRGRRAITAARAMLRRDETSRARYYWTAVAAGYDSGIRRGRAAAAGG